MPYSERGVFDKARGIADFLKSDSLFEHGTNSRGIHIPDPGLITQPLGALNQELVSREGRAAVNSMRTLLESAGVQNGLFVRTIDTGQLIDLEIRGMPEDIEGQLTEEQRTKYILAFGNLVRIEINRGAVLLEARSEGDLNSEGTLISQLVQQMPSQQRLFLIGRIVEIADDAVRQASH